MANLIGSNADQVSVNGMLGTMAFKEANQYASLAVANTFTAAQNEAQGADIASSGTINLTTATGNLVDVTGGATITAVTLAQGAERTVRFTGILTLTHGASLILPGGVNITTAAGDFAVFRGYSAGVVRCVVYTKASGVAVVADSATGDHEVYLTTENGYGSTNTKIKRYSVIQRSVGTALTYADSAANGMSITVNSAGIYSVELSAQTSADSFSGMSVNSNQLTTGIGAITASHRVLLGHNVDSLAAGLAVVSGTLILAVNDVVRVHTEGTADNAALTTYFRIRKIGKAI